MAVVVDGVPLFGLVPPGVFWSEAAVAVSQRHMTGNGAAQDSLLWCDVCRWTQPVTFTQPVSC